MPKVIFVDVDGDETVVELDEGASVMEAAIHGNVSGIEAECGGSCSCATCHVYVDEAFAGRLPAPRDDELGMLEAVAAPRRANSRLSCQLLVRADLDGLRVALPETQV
ncbi:MAG: 2Fe-2S iron-sulfur cluster binding domain-containing protein [Ectothiorhodospiraceae bacterium]|nr:2Fe-2S iron-sulfur cluster binding domain-containing protein [Chromatiales bacterium]MCP5153710.1 2Fe-2S iron-sulfur cluster binding domain-containing protein [Ectothiorhodospiraceae bacterium]